MHSTGSILQDLSTSSEEQKKQIEKAKEEFIEKAKLWRDKYHESFQQGMNPGGLKHIHIERELDLKHIENTKKEYGEMIKAQKKLANLLSKKGNSQEAKEIINKLKAEFIAYQENNHVNQTKDQNEKNVEQAFLGLDNTVKKIAEKEFISAFEKKEYAPAMDVLRNNLDIINLEMMVTIGEKERSTTPILCMAGAGQYENVANLIDAMPKDTTLNYHSLSPITLMLNSAANNLDAAEQSKLSKAIVKSCERGYLTYPPDREKMVKLGLTSDQEIRKITNNHFYSSWTEKKLAGSDTSIPDLIEILKGENSFYHLHQDRKQRKIQGLEIIQKAINDGGDVRQAIEEAKKIPEFMEGKRVAKLINKLEGKVNANEPEPKISHTASSSSRKKHTKI